MKRRVGIEGSYRELAMVECRYEIYIEEHLRVSNRNLMKVDLDGFAPLLASSIKLVLLLSWSFYMTIRVVPRNIAFRPFIGRIGFFICFYFNG